jgi:photosystem II stability/assembly factor-like uncharacterized protein
MKTYTMMFFILTMFCFSSPLFSQWVVQHSGLPASQNPTLIFSAVDSNVCWGIQYEFNNPKWVLTTNGGVTWSLNGIPGISGFQANSIYGLNGSTAWITLDDTSGATTGGIYKTTDGGLNWIKQSSAFQGSGGHPSKIYFFDANNGLCTGQPRNGYWEIYTTTDGGTNWTRVPSANIPAPDAGGDFTGGGANRGAGDNFWFATATCSVYHTADRGMTWSVTRTIFPTPPAYGSEVAFKDNLNGLTCSYFGDDINKLAGSADGGQTWSSLTSLPPHPSFYFITYVPGTSGTYFLTSHSNIGYPEPTVPGSAYTVDGGMTWAQVDNLAHGEPSFAANKIGWSAGSGDTIYKWTNKTLGTGDDFFHNQSDKITILSQNYPNPFTSSTSIEYKIPGYATVIIKVYDILGLEVATLVDEKKSAGTYKVIFNSGGLSRGTYYYRLQAGDFMQTKKLLIQ